MSRKHVGANSQLFNAVKGTKVTTGALTENTWFKISEVAATASALPVVASQPVGSIFKSPKGAGDAITLAVGDEVWPLTLTEICKVDVEISGEKGTIDTTDSCDYPFNVSIPDGFTNLSGSINTMMRFDDSTDQLMPVTQEFLARFYDIVEDDGEGSYTLTAKNDDDLIMFLNLNKEQVTPGNYETYFITPAILTSVANNAALKDVFKADYGWSKGQGPASIYQLMILA